MTAFILYYNKISIFELKRDTFKYVMTRVLGNVIGFIIELFSVKWT